MNPKLRMLLLIVAPGLMLWLAWPPVSQFWLLFFGLVPLLQLQHELRHGKAWKWFLVLYVTLLVWNVLTTWWVMNSTVPGAIMMLVLNSLFMCVPWLIYRPARRMLGEPADYLLVILWLMYEYLHHRWDLSWPWLTLGNGLATAPWLVQWYDITGTLGGSAFVLGMNILIWKAWQKRSRAYALTAAGLFVFVLGSSLFNGWKWERMQKPAGSLNVTVCQPSFDPWEEKFVRDPMDLEREMIAISEKALSQNTNLLVWPETSLTDGLDVDDPEQHPLIYGLRNLQKKYPKLSILTGADMQQVYRNAPRRPNATARPTRDPEVWWNAYNSAVFLEPGKKLQHYHKSILVPGTEQMPFVDAFPFIEKLAIRLDENSISGSLGKSERPVALGTGNYKVAPIICYESIYGDYTGRYVKDGAALLAVVTNDAWWGNTPGYKQHLAYARLRAIEHRRWLVRSANTGISGFIDPMGRLQDRTEWWTKTAISHKVDLYNVQTLYTRMGDITWLIILCGICATLGTLAWMKGRRQAAL